MEDTIKNLLDELETAFATLNIGQDHGITPQAAKACREVWSKVAMLRTKDEKYAQNINKNAFKNCLCE